MKNNLRENYHILPNGMKVLFVNEKKYKTSSIFLIINGGSIYENKNTAGFFHILEHTLFNSSKSMNKEKRDEAFRKLGAQYNGGTGNTSVEFIITCPSCNTDKVFALFYNMLFFPNFDKCEFETEVGAILSERENLISEPFYILQEETKKNIYKFSNKNSIHPYSNTIIGTEESIKSATPSKIRKLYNKFFKPSNMVLTIVGSNFDEDKIIENLLEIKDQDYSFTNDELNNLIKKCDNTIYKTGFKFIPREDKNSISILISSKNPKLVYNDDQVAYWTKLDNTNNPYLHDLFTYWLGEDNFSVLHKLFRNEQGFVYAINSMPIYNRFVHFNQIVTDIPYNKVKNFLQSFRQFIYNDYKFHKPINKKEFDDLIKCIKYQKDFIYYRTDIEAKNLALQIFENHINLKEILSLEERYKRLDKITLKEFNEFIDFHFNLNTKEPFSCFIAAIGTSKAESIIEKEIEIAKFNKESRFQ